MKTVSLLLLLFCCRVAVHAQADLKTNNGLVVSAKTNNISLSDTANYVTLSVRLTNSSSDTIWYVHMKRGWMNSFITNSTALSAEKYNFRNDAIEINILPPKSNTEYYVTCDLNKPFNKAKKKKYRIGFNAIFATSPKSLSGRNIEIKQMHNIVWSNNFKLRIPNEQ